MKNSGSVCTLQLAASRGTPRPHEATGGTCLVPPQPRGRAEQRPPPQPEVFFSPKIHSGDLPSPASTGAMHIAELQFASFSRKRTKRFQCGAGGAGEGERTSPAPAARGKHPHHLLLCSGGRVSATGVPHGSHPAEYVTCGSHTSPFPAAHPLACVSCPSVLRCLALEALGQPNKAAESLQMPARRYTNTYLDGVRAHAVLQIPG